MTLLANMVKREQRTKLFEMAIVFEIVKRVIMTKPNQIYCLTIFRSASSSRTRACEKKKLRDVQQRAKETSFCK